MGQILLGPTEVYAFSNNVRLIADCRTIPEVIDVGGITDVSKLEPIFRGVGCRNYELLNIFIICDGTFDDQEIIFTSTSPRKTHCNVFVISVDSNTPPPLAISVRNEFHSGSNDIPEIVPVHQPPIELKVGVDENAGEEKAALSSGIWAGRVETAMNVVKKLYLKYKYPIICPIGTRLPGDTFKNNNRFFIGEWVYVDTNKKFNGAKISLFVCHETAFLRINNFKPGGIYEILDIYDQWFVPKVFCPYLQPPKPFLTYFIFINMVSLLEESMSKKMALNTQNSRSKF